MRNFLLIGKGTDTIPLLAAIARQPAIWTVDTYLRDYPQGPFGEIDSIILRFPTKSVKETEQEVADHLSKYDQHECVWQPAIDQLPEVRALVMGLFNYVGGTRLGRVMINRIKPGGVIFPHKDTPEHAEYWSRHHICLQAEPGVVFRCEDESVFMRPGETWYFDNALEHEVINNSQTDRISMVVDVRCA